MIRETDRRRVAELLGRAPMGDFEVVVRHRDGTPVVIANAPLLDDGTPMPTRWWLVGEPERTWVGRLEADGGVLRVQAELSADRIADAHARYAALRDALIPVGHSGPRPFGGVGGTRRGVKCLHAHYAWWLAGGADPVGGWVAERLAEAGYVADVEPSRPRRVAAIDCGTNSTRLLVAEQGPAGEVVTLARQMQITRLGQGVDATGRLAPEAIERTVQALAGYRSVMDGLGVSAVRATATSAARDASNRADFFVPVAAVLGVEAELLSGADEAAASFAGATADLLGDPGRYLVVDVGGGSTEFALGAIDVGRVPSLEAAESVDIGCVRITERFLASDPPTWGELSAARTHCVEVVSGVLERVCPLHDADVLVGLAGTVSTLASIDQGLEAYDRARIHHHRLSADRVRELTGRLMRLDATQRAAIAGMESGRVGVIVGGALVVSAILDVLGVDEVLVSEADILDGLAMSLFA